VTTKPRKPLPVNLAWAASLVLVLSAGYVFSYPVAVRITDGRKLAVYRPVELMIEHDILRQPLLKWADVCGVGDLVRWWTFTIDEP
jgi:hypothetical protein